jgi:hypothetical protein
MSKVDMKKISVPIEWFVGSIVFIVGLACPATYWVFGVNEAVKDVPEIRRDLKLVKKKMQIPDESEEAATHGFFDAAHAAVRK